MEDKNGKLKDALKHYDYVSQNRYQVMSKLLSDGYPESEIIEEFDNYTFKPKWKGSPLGIVMILLAVAIYFSMIETFGMFNYSLNSSGDFIRLNEWVMKPFVLLSVLFVGINVTTNKGYINKWVKIIMILVLSLMLIVSLRSMSPFSGLISIIGIVIFAVYKMPTVKYKSDASTIIESIRNGGMNSVKILKTIVANDCKPWKGTAFFIGLLLSLCLLVISPVDLSTEFVRRSYVVQELQTIDLVLGYCLYGLIAMNFIGAILVNINVRKFRWYLVILSLFSLFTIIIGLIHPNFQISIIPALISLLSCLFSLLIIFRERPAV